jgi:hypothetical protein
MKSFALRVRHVLIVAVAISASALAQVPNLHPTAPPAPRRTPLAKPSGNNQLKKMTPKNKIAGKAKGKRGAAKKPLKKR